MCDSGFDLQHRKQNKVSVSTNWENGWGLHAVASLKQLCRLSNTWGGMHDNVRPEMVADDAPPLFCIASYQGKRVWAHCLQIICLQLWQSLDSWLTNALQTSDHMHDFSSGFVISLNERQRPIREVWTVAWESKEKMERSAKDLNRRN